MSKMDRTISLRSSWEKNAFLSWGQCAQNAKRTRSMRLVASAMAWAELRAGSSGAVFLSKRLLSCQHEGY